MTKEAPESKIEQANTAKIFLAKVGWDPVRYSDNIGVQFLLELGKIGEEKGIGKEAVINGFLSKMAKSDNLYSEPFEENEQLALERVRQRCNLNQQLQDSALIGNIRKSVFSRRAVIGGLGGMAAGSILSNVMGGINPKNDPAVVRSTNAVNELAAERDELLSREQELSDALAKRDEDLSEEERRAVIDLARDKATHNRQADSAQQVANEAIGPYRRVFERLDVVMPVLGTGMGIYAATAGEGKKQSGLKFEAFVKQMDDVINYRLGRSPMSQSHGRG